jgi:Spy/CpxP family protein refolding chaperone
VDDPVTDPSIFKCVLAAMLLTAAAQHVPERESRPNAPAKDFERAAVGGGRFKLSEAWGKGWVLLAFVRGDW